MVAGTALTVHSLGSGKQLCAARPADPAHSECRQRPAWSPDSTLVAAALVTPDQPPYRAPTTSVLVLNTRSNAAAAELVVSLSQLLQLQQVPVKPPVRGVALLQVQDRVSCMGWSPPIPGQPGSSLLCVQQDWSGMVSTVYDSTLKPLVTWPHRFKSLHLRWAGDASVAGVFQDFPCTLNLPYNTNQQRVQLWQPPGANESSPAALTGRQAVNWFSDDNDAFILDFGWSRDSSMLLLVEDGQDREVTLHIWQPGPGRMTFHAPKDIRAATWSPCGQNVLLFS